MRRFDILSENTFESVAQIQRRTQRPFDEVMAAIKSGLKNGSVVGKQMDQGSMTTYPAFKLRGIFDF